MAIIITGDAFNNVLTAGSNANHELYGLAGSDTLTALGGADILDGGSGADTMAGGTGNDVYKVDNAGDVVTENWFSGVDRVDSSISYTLGSNLENLTLTGTAYSGTGNTLNNVIIGNASGNWLDGGVGADTMQGLAGNDTYVVDNAADVVIEAAAGGTDTVRASISYVLGSEVENLTLTGVAAINGTGNALNNVIYGNGAANVIVGGAGADTMDGGLGNDTYYVDNVGDSASEFWAFGGVDQVYSRAASFTLGNNVENLTLQDMMFQFDPVSGGFVIVPGGVNGTGNALGNVITGNALANQLNGMAGNDTINGGGGNDTIDGGTGNDTMAGGTGNDLFKVDVAADVVSELGGEGIDTVEATVSYTITDFDVEHLTLTGTAFSGTGNANANTLIGNASSNVLNGLGGADNMQGRAGNDIYHVDNVFDVVSENAAEGTADWVVATVNYTIVDVDVETLQLSGAATSGTGNASNNSLYGTANNNTLLGLGGNDVIYASGGIDTLQGGTGSDDLHGGDGSDTLRAVDAIAGANDLAEDRFWFDTVLNGSVDNIDMASFQAGNEGIDDELVVENFFFGALLSTVGTNLGQLSAAHYTEVLNFTAVFNPNAANVAVGIWNETSTGRLFYNPDFAGGGNAVQFAVVNAGGVAGGSALLSAEEFTLV